MPRNVYKQMFQNMSNPGVIHDIVTDPEDGSSDCHFIEVNPAFEKITGFTREQLIGKRLQDVFPEMKTDWIKNQGAILISDKTKHFQGCSHETKSYFEISTFPVGLQKIAFVMDDISRSKKKEAQLLEEKARMEALSPLKEQFFAEMSHELRAPLNGIVGMASLLMVEDLAEDSAIMATTIHKSSLRLVKLINNLLDSTRLESNMMTLDLEWVNIREHLTELIRELKSTAQEKGIDLTLQLDSTLPKIIYTDPLRLVQILTNLVSNAIKFTEKGSVQLICEVDCKTLEKSTLRFHVMDTGVGIHDEQVEKIFNRFTQLKCESSKKQCGSGLGLEISRKLATLMGGSIKVVSQVGKGSTFTLEIPHNMRAFGE